MSKRRAARNEFMGALRNFVNAMHELSSRWNDLDMDDSNLPDDRYPFHESFDDLLSKAVNWHDDTKKKMEAPIQYVKIPIEQYNKLVDTINAQHAEQPNREPRMLAKPEFIEE